MKEFLYEARAHVVHVAPVLIVFFYLLIKEHMVRRKAKHSLKKEPTQ